MNPLSQYSHFRVWDSNSWLRLVVEAEMGALLMMALRFSSATAASRGDIFSNDTDRTLVISICIFVTVLCICIVTGHMLEEKRCLDQSITAIAIVSLERRDFIFFFVTAQFLRLVFKVPVVTVGTCAMLRYNFKLIKGCIVGTIILFASKGENSHILRFDEEFFFIYLLPPIIFNAGSVH